MKNRIVSMCLAIMLVGGLSMAAIQDVKAAEEKTIDGSKLTHESESVGYDTKMTRGIYLLTGYSKITKLGKEKAKLVKQICLESDQFILQGLSKKEQREIISLLKQMNNTLEKEDTHGNTK